MSKIQVPPLPGINAFFFNQKIAQNEPLKWMPSTQAKATRRSAKDLELHIHRIAHEAFAAAHCNISGILDSHDEC